MNVSLLLILCLLFPALSLKSETIPHSDAQSDIVCDAFRDPTWSPDSVHLAFVAFCGRYPDIFIANLETGVIRNITQSIAEGELNPVWSYDGEMLAYDVGYIGFARKDVRVWHMDEEIAETLTIASELDGRSNSYPVWSHTENQIAFMSENSERSDIVVYDFESQETFVTTSELGGIFVFPEWSYDSNYLAFTSVEPNVYGLWVVDLETMQVNQLTSLSASYISWLPEDNVLTFRSNQADFPVNYINLDGTVTSFEEVLSYIDAPRISDLVWSTDANLVALEVINNSKHDIWVVNLENMNGIKLTDSTASEDLSFAWSPDNRQITFVSREDGETIWIIDIDGTNLRQITPFPINNG